MATTKKQSQSQDLRKFSYEYQCGILKLFMEDEEFTRSTAWTMNQNHFTASAELREIATIIKEKSIELNRCLTYEELDHFLKKKVSDAITLENCQALVSEKIQSSKLSEPELKTIRDEYHDFLTDMETIKLGKEIEEISKNGGGKDSVLTVVKEYDTRTTFEEVSANKIDSSDNHFNSLLDDDNCETVPTGCKPLDERLGGGMRKGDFGIFLAGTGIGKTCVTSGFAAHAAWHGYKVAHVILEDKPDDIEAKYYGYICNAAVSTFRGKTATPEGKAFIRERREAIKDRLAEMFANNVRLIAAIDKNKKIHRMSVKDIDVQLTRLSNEGFDADLLIIDYFDRIKCLIPKLEIFQKDQMISDELNELVINHNVGGWVPSQGNKSVQDRATKLTISNMSGGAWKGYTAQIVVSMQKYMDELSSNSSTVQMLKNRYNNDFTPIQIEFDNGTCRFGRELNDDSAIFEGSTAQQVAQQVYQENKRK